MRVFIFLVLTALVSGTVAENNKVNELDTATLSLTSEESTFEPTTSESTEASGSVQSSELPTSTVSTTTEPYFIPESEISSYSRALSVIDSMEIHLQNLVELVNQQQSSQVRDLTLLCEFNPRVVSDIPDEQKFCLKVEVALAKIEVALRHALEDSRQLPGSRVGDLERSDRDLVEVSYADSVMYSSINKVKLNGTVDRIYTLSEMTGMELEAQRMILDRTYQRGVVYTAVFTTIFGVLLISMVVFLSYVVWSQAVVRHEAKKNKQRSKSESPDCSVGYKSYSVGYSSSSDEFDVKKTTTVQYKKNVYDKKNNKMESPKDLVNEGYVLKTSNVNVYTVPVNTNTPQNNTPQNNTPQNNTPQNNTPQNNTPLYLNKYAKYDVTGMEQPITVQTRYQKYNNGI